jgi:hypothetical protein
VFASLGDELVKASVTAQGEVVLAAPFVKEAAFSRVVDGLSDRTSLVVVTRWAPEEIAAGVSDLEIWPLVKARPRSALLLRSNLHAKYYRFDERVWTGSANLTDMALGWSASPNLELLVEQSAVEMATFEAVLRQGCLQVDDEVYRALQAAVDTLPRQAMTVVPNPTREDDGDKALWFPRTLQVQRLFDCYRGNENVVIASVFRDGVKDLNDLEVPEGLNEPEFKELIAARLFQLTITGVLDYEARTAVTRERGADLLVSLGLADGNDALDRWDVLAAWLVHFLPSRFRLKSTLAGPALDRSQRVQ